MSVSLKLGNTAFEKERKIQALEQKVQELTQKL